MQNPEYEFQALVSRVTKLSNIGLVSPIFDLKFEHPTGQKCRVFKLS